MSTLHKKAAKSAELLRAASLVCLPAPASCRQDEDCIRLVFGSVIHVREWARYFHVKTATEQEAENPGVVAEFFDAEADGIPVRGLAVRRHLTAVS